MSIKPILIRPPLHFGESLVSYLARVSLANGYGTANRIGYLVQERCEENLLLHSPRKATTFRFLSELLVLDPIVLYTATPHVYAPIINHPAYPKPTLMLDRQLPLLQSRNQFHFLAPLNDAQFCPLCLKKNPAHLLKWHLQTVAVCLDHWVLLVKRCPGCQMKLTIANVVQCTCGRCGFDLREAPLTKMKGHDFLLDAHFHFDSWLEGRPYPNDRGFPDVSVNLLYIVMMGIFRALMTVRKTIYISDLYPIIPVFPIERYSDLTPFKCYHLLMTAFDAVTTWPHRFDDFVWAFKSRDNGAHYFKKSLTMQYGTLYQTMLLVHWDAPPFAFVQKAFGNYLAEHEFLTHHMMGQRWYLKHSPKFEWMTRAAAAVFLNVPIASLNRLIEYGALETHKVEDGKPKMIKGEEAKRLKRSWASAISIDEAAAVLGTSPSYVAWLIALEQLKVIRGPDTDGSAEITVSKKSVKNVLVRLRRQKTRMHGMIRDGLTFTQAAKLLFNWNLYPTELFKGIFTGHIYYHLHPPGLVDDIRISPAENERIKRKIAEKNELWSMREAKEALANEFWSIQQLIDIGLLLPISQNGEGPLFLRGKIMEHLGGVQTSVDVRSWQPKVASESLVIQESSSSL